jgi:CHAD domain-containing protein
MTAPPVPPPAPPFNPGLMAQPAARAVRVVALARLDEVTRGYDLFLAGDPEGLHDLRVALRRLRTWLRAYRPFVEDTLKKKTWQRLRTLTRATSAARDAEVATAWVAAQMDAPARARAGFRDATRRLERERDAAFRAVRERLERDLPGLVAELAKPLAVYFDRQTVDEPAVAESMSDAATAAIQRHTERLEAALDRVTSLSDIKEAHRARIAAKRLRYVLEPLYAESDARAAVQHLVDLQDFLGTARDAHLLAERFVREIGEMAARGARSRAQLSIGAKRAGGEYSVYLRLRPGLLELARRAHARERESFAGFRRRWGNRAAVEDPDPETLIP